jgi:hypothetical protein
VASTGQPVTIENLQETRLMVPPNIPGLERRSRNGTDEIDRTNWG